MALTKIPSELSSTTGIVDNSNPTAITIDSNENVGIGTSSPSSRLDVNGQGCFTKTYSFASTNYHIKLKSAYGNGISSYIGNVSSGDRMNISAGGYYYGASLYQLTDGATGMGTINIGEDGTLIYQSTTGATANSTVNPSERMRIDSSGNLLVGKTSTSVGVNGFQIATNGTTYSSISSSNTYHVYNTTTPGYTFYVGFTGGVINYQANNVNLSDEREKKNIEPLESKWDSVKSWSLKTFHYNHQADESIKNYGVIAQDVEKTNPEAINVYKKDENTERKGVKEQQMMWMAIKALQEAQTRIETLEARVTELENN